MEHICRTCAKEQINGKALKLFDRRHKELLAQIEDVTGLLLENSGLPKLMCSTCHQNLRQAYQFRENVIRAQALLSDQIKDERTVGECKNLVTTEFFHVCVKEEEDPVKSETDIIEEKEISIESQDGNVHRKESGFCVTHQKDTLEINPNEEENSNLDDRWSTSDSTVDLNLSNNTQSGDEMTFRSDTLQLNNVISTLEENSKSTSPKRKKNKFQKRNKIATTLSRRGEEESKEEYPIVAKKRKKEKADNPNRFICDQCGNYFTCSHYFKLHLRRHAGDRQCACELCPDKFFTNSELRRHMRKHTGERPFACQFCDRKFTDYSTRIKHQRTHTNERPFTCSQCGKSFTSTYILKNHMLTHTGERHFRCDVCDKAFGRRTHLVVHFRSIMHKQALEKIKISQDKNKTDQREVSVDISSLLI